MKKIVLSLLLLSMLRAGPCQIDLSCGFYTACLAKHCPCQNGEEDYAITYGYKYCQRFLHPAIALSPQGIRWRDSTLRCLQRAIAAHLDKPCRCRQMNRLAFDSHVKCYTRPGRSICDLPPSDIETIKKRIDTQDLWDAEGWKTMLAIAAVCHENNASQFWDDTGAILRRTIDGVLAP